MVREAYIVCGDVDFARDAVQAENTPGWAGAETGASPRGRRHGQAVARAAEA